MKALPTAEKALGLLPDNPAILDTTGWILVEQGNTERGLPMLQKAVAIMEKDGAAAPVVAQIRYHLAHGMAKAGDKAGARKELERALSSGNAFPEINEAKALLKTL